MKNFLIWIADWAAYILLPIVYYTLRLAKTPFWWIPIESHSEWSVSEKLLTNDLMMFIVIVVLSVTWFFWGLWWLLYTFIGLVILLVIAGVYFELRKKWRNRKN